MTVFLDGPALRIGLIIFRRGEVKHRNWRCRIKLPMADH